MLLSLSSYSDLPIEKTLQTVIGMKTVCFYKNLISFSGNTVPNSATPGAGTGTQQGKFTLSYRGCWELGSQVNGLGREGQGNKHQH